MEINNLTIARESFMGKRAVIKNATADMAERVNVIYGRPGSGKTTLLSGVAGLESLESGTVDYRGTLFFLMEIPERGFIYTRCREEIAEGGKISNRDEELLNELGISPDMLDISPWDLSRGEKKRIALANILRKVRRQKEGRAVVVLDDPFRDLDTKGKYLFLKKVFNNSAVDKVVMATANHEDMGFLDKAGLKYGRYSIKEGKLRKN